MFDYEPVLRKWLKKIEPKNILEYGPGKSTNIMLEECPQVSITTIEHDEKWYEKAKDMFGDKVNLVLENNSKIMSHYACWPLLQQDKKKYDLIFIDGRRRVECLIVAQQVVHKNGIVILHDAERVEYQVGVDLFSIVEFVDRTVVLKKKWGIIN